MAQLLSNLPVGAKLKFGKYSVNGEPSQEITWLVVAKSHASAPAYPSDAITLLTEKIIDARAYDSAEPNNPITERKNGGYNRYGLSNIDQWLNKDSPAGAWYEARHSVDHPPELANDYYGTYYVGRPGFLNAFTEEEKNIIQNTTIRVMVPNEDGGGYEDIARKVFLPSTTEVGYGAPSGVVEGAQWVYFSSASRMTSLTATAYEKSFATIKPSSPSEIWHWFLRSPVYNGGKVYHTSVTDVASAAHPHYGYIGVRPAINLSSTTLVTDEIDVDGCYAVKFNDAPHAPSTIVLPSALYGGKSNVISWAVANDPDGDIVTYHLECSINGGEYTQVYSGTSAAYAHLVPFGTSTVSYRVKAIDPSGESSAYTTSATVTVINNSAPVISGSDTNLGVKSDDFTGTYTITDANSDIVTVTEAIDGVQIRALVATLGETITYGVTGNTWLALANGSHTLTISATDGIDTTVRTIVFTKLADKFSIQNSTPWASSTMPSRIMLVVTRNIPSTSTFKVEVCNNGYDASPTWEDCTDAVKSGLVHVLTNKTKTAANWGVLVRVTVERNGATGACYVSAIGGNFE